MPVKIKVEGIFPPKNVMAKKGDKILMYIFTALEHEVADTLKEGMEKRVRKWDSPPMFTSNVTDTGKRFSLLVTPAGRGKIKWVRVSGGVSGHSIAPRRYNYLSIKKGYQPHTKPGNVYGGPGTYRGPFRRVYGAVRHPGIEPRRFEEHIVKEKTHLVHQLLRIAATAGAKS